MTKPKQAPKPKRNPREYSPHFNVASNRPKATKKMTPAEQQTGMTAEQLQGNQQRLKEEARLRREQASGGEAA